MNSYKGSIEKISEKSYLLLFGSEEVRERVGGKVYLLGSHDDSAEQSHTYRKYAMKKDEG